MVQSSKGHLAHAQTPLLVSLFDWLVGLPLFTFLYLEQETILH
jgi:hypothetical protein